MFVLRPLDVPYHDVMASLITLFLFAFATARTVELVMRDEITRGLRKWWNRHAPKGSLRAKFIECRWCVSIWAAGLIWALAYAVFVPPAPGPWWLWWPAATMALSYMSVLLADAQELLNHKRKVMAALMVTDEPDEDGR